MKSTLMDLLAVERELEDTFRECGGVIEPGSELEARWNENCAALVAKVDGYAVFLKAIKSRGESKREFARQLIASADADENLCKRLLDYADRAMGERGELVGEHVKLKRVKNPPRLVVKAGSMLSQSLCEVEQIEQCQEIDGWFYAIEKGATPGDCWMYRYRPDKAKIREAIKSGELVPGAELTQGHRVEVKA